MAVDVLVARACEAVDDVEAAGRACGRAREYSEPQRLPAARDGEAHDPRAPLRRRLGGGRAAHDRNVLTPPGELSSQLERGRLDAATGRLEPLDHDRDPHVRGG